jgi:hypothetical protein
MDFFPSLFYVIPVKYICYCMCFCKAWCGDLATDYCRQLTSCFAKAHTIADVFNRYDVKQTRKKIH